MIQGKEPVYDVGCGTLCRQRKDRVANGTAIAPIPVAARSKA
jgi:hypothetical protein